MILSKRTLLVFSCLCLCVSLSGCGLTGSEPKKDFVSAQDIDTKVGSNVVRLTTSRTSVIEDVQVTQTIYTSGAGVLLDDGYILSDEDVVKNRYDEEIFDTIDVNFVKGGFVRNVPVVGVDEKTGLALIGPIEKKGTVSFVSTKSLKIGNDVYAIMYEHNEYSDHYPGGDIKDLQFEVAMAYERELTHSFVRGIKDSYNNGLHLILSNVGRNGTTNTAGSPLFNDKAELIGIVGYSADRLDHALSMQDVEGAIKRIKKNQ